MTDKVQKILSEITTRKLCTMDEHMAFYNDTAKEDYRFLSEIEELIKALQEEPVAPKVLEDILNAKTAAESLGISQEEHDKIVDELIYGKESKFKVGDKIKFKGIHNEDMTRVITNIQKDDGGGFRYFFADGSIHSIVGDDVIELVKEPVSEELDKAAIDICSKVLKAETITIDGYEYVVLSDAEECFKVGANYVLEQIEKLVKFNKWAAKDLYELIEQLKK